MQIINIIKRTIPVILFLGLLTFSSSCKKHLAESLTTDIDQFYLYNNPDGLKAGVVGLYNLNRSLYHNGNHEWHSAVLMASRGDLTVPRAGVLSKFGQYKWGTTPDGYQAGLMSFHWKLYYKIANKATAIIVATEKMEEMDEAEKKQVIAEAKFFRANSYFIIYRMFNNIYVTETAINSENAFDVIENKSSDAEVLSLLERDLDYAIENLDWTDDFGRITKGTAKHVRAKVAMWQKDWAEAKSQTESLINDGPHALVRRTGDVFKGDMNNSEQLLTMQFSSGGENGAGKKSMINWNFIPIYKFVDGATVTEAYGGRGAAFLLPNNYLLGLLAEDANDDRTNNNYFRMFYYYNDAPNLPAGVSLGDTIDIYEPTTDPANPSATNSSYYERIHPSCLKFKEEGADPTVVLQQTSVMVYRLAETYLIAAEANMELGDNAAALTHLNTVRNRAHAANLGAIDQQVILDERARELSFEGQRWYTLKRMGLDVLRHQIQTYAGDDYYKKDARNLFMDHHINFPIPQSMLDFLGASYPQNEGY